MIGMTGPFFRSHLPSSSFRRKPLIQLATSGYFFPSPLWGGMSERSEDRVGSQRRLHPTPAPPHKGEGNSFFSLTTFLGMHLLREGGGHREASPLHVDTWSSCRLSQGPRGTLAGTDGGGSAVGPPHRDGRSSPAMTSFERRAGLT